MCLPAAQWSNAAKEHHLGNFTGVATLKDMQVYARLIERGQFNAKALATATFSLDQAKDALQAAADRTTVGAIIVFPS
jgi:threonine dehydrogenase-like Zn-dependent dehydrogenase